MRFLVDANLPRLTVNLIAQLGHEVEFARDIGLASASDEAIASHAQRAQVALITRDMDFVDI